MIFDLLDDGKYEIMITCVVDITHVMQVSFLFIFLVQKLYPVSEYCFTKPAFIKRMLLILKEQVSLFFTVRN